METPAKRNNYRERLGAAVEEWSRHGDVARMESLYQALGRGIPGEIVENAMRELSRTEIERILSDRSVGPTPMRPEKEPSRKGLKDMRGEHGNVSGDTPLHSASRNGQEDIVLSLLTESANPDVVNATNNTGRTPLHEACSYGREAIVSILLQHGANVNASSHSRRTPLHLACARGHVSIISILLDNDPPANIDAQDSDGNAPLHEAYRWHGPGDVVELLVRRGADLTILNNDGREPDSLLEP